MPDYNPSRGPGEGRMRRPVVRAPPPRRYGPGGLPTEGADPPPKVHPFAPWIALILVVGFLGLQLYPATHFRHPKDPNRAWVPIHYTKTGIDHQKTFEGAQRIWLGGGRGGEQGEENPLVVADEVEDLERFKAHEILRRHSTQDVQIFLSTDEKDLRPLAVVINSTISNAKHPERIRFHLVIPASANKIEYFKLKSSFPAASIDIFSEGIDLGEISKKLVTYRKDSKARKELNTPYNFLLYYLPQMLKDKDIDKIIYLDTDVVVKGDIAELYRKGLEGFPVAAVKDCSQHFETYFDFKKLDQIQTKESGLKSWLPTEPFDPKECVFNRGALVIDIKRWIEQNVTETIDWWMNEFNNADGKPLFKYGLSQPPFLLALYKNYKVLDHEWNVRGLGRNTFSEKEMDFYTETYGQRPQKHPYVSMESDYAKILHFNGQFKPWKRDRLRRSDQDVVSLCGEEGKECYKMWWDYLDENADTELRETTG